MSAAEGRLALRAVLPGRRAASVHDRLAPMSAERASVHIWFFAQRAERET